MEHGGLVPRAWADLPLAEASTTWAPEIHGVVKDYSGACGQGSGEVRLRGRQGGKHQQDARSTQ